MAKQWLTSEKISLPASASKPMRAMENYQKNCAAFGDKKGILLHGQGTEPLCKLTYGTYPLSWNGCELIAVCNACTLLGEKTYFPDVVFEFELNNMHYVFKSGYWGTAPKALYRYFAKHGIAHQKYHSAEEFESAAEGSHCGIVSFWNNRKSTAKLWGLDFFSGGLHTVAYERKNGRYYVYNLYSKDTAARVFGKISDIYKEKRFIIGYTFNEQK